MPLYIGDYLRDTRRLTTLQHGAYMLLIMEYWVSGGLPNDDSQLAQIAGLSIEQWIDIKSIIGRFFDEGWKHKRIDKELAEAEANFERRSAAGRAAVAARESKRSSNRSCIRSSNGSPIDHTDDIPSPSPSHSSSLRSDENNTPRRVASRKADAIRECLEAVLEPEIAIGVIDHRRGLRKPLTLLAAQGLAKAFAATADPNSAARTMIERGWQGFQPEWLENHGVPNGHGRPPTRAGPTTGQLMMEAVQGKFTEGLIRDGYVAAEDRTGTAGIAERDRQSGD